LAQLPLVTANHNARINDAREHLGTVDWQTARQVVLTVSTNTKLDSLSGRRDRHVIALQQHEAVARLVQTHEHECTKAIDSD